MKFTKELEGTVIYATPTGNNARRGKCNEIIEFEVVKVKRKYVELIREGFRHTDNYCQNSGGTQSAIASGYVNNSGYKFFPSKAAINAHSKQLMELDEIESFFRYRRGQALTAEKVSMIYSIIEGEL